jgi:hypothetical protein
MTDDPEHDGKSDRGKLPWHLLPFRAVTYVVAVLDFGAHKYSENGWKTVPRKRDRYFSATMPHLIAYWTGEKLDKESGLPHLAHSIANLIFLMESDEEQPP